MGGVAAIPSPQQRPPRHGTPGSTILPYLPPPWQHQGYDSIRMVPHIAIGLDGIFGTPLDSDPSLRFEHTKAAFDNLQPGITHFIIHAAKDTPELRAIADDWACRNADYQTFLREDLREYIQQIGVQVIGYRALQALMPH